MRDEYDVIVIGGGPAGLTAGMYAARARLRTLLIEKMMPGGQAAVTAHVENYPGFPKGLSGAELGAAMEEQAVGFGMELAFDNVASISIEDPWKMVRGDSNDYQARALIVATGAQPAWLDVSDEYKFRGRGVSYCATCDGALFANKKVAVVGGGDSAIDEALFLTRFASKVTVIHRRAELRAARILQERAFANPKIEFRWDSVVAGLEGDQGLERIVLRNVKTNEMSTIDAAGVFVYIGLKPNSELVRDILDLDEWGYIVADETTTTKIPGVFVAGDVRTKKLRQVVTAVGDGAVAAHMADHYLAGLPAIARR